MGNNKLILSCLEKAPTSYEDFVQKVYEDNPADYSNSQYDLEEVNRKMKRAILYLIIRKEYYGSLIPHLNIYGCTKRPRFKTMCTDGSSIIFHPEFVLKQSEEALRMVLAHEIMHCVGDHMDRRGSRDPELWNVATDYSINPLLNGESGFEWPIGDDGKPMGLYEEKYEGMRAEDIYDDLVKKYPGGLPQQMKKKGDMGEVVDSDEPMPEPDEGMEIQKSIDSGDDEGDSESEKGEGKGGGEGKGEGEGDGEDGQGGKGKGQGEGDGEDGQGGKGKGGKDTKGGTQPGSPGQKSKGLPSVGQRVMLKDGTEATIKKVLPNGDIEI
jgi:hypothetical protein